MLLSCQCYCLRGVELVAQWNLLPLAAVAVAVWLLVGLTCRWGTSDGEATDDEFS